MAAQQRFRQGVQGLVGKNGFTQENADYINTLPMDEANKIVSKLLEPDEAISVAGVGAVSKRSGKVLTAIPKEVKLASNAFELAQSLIGKSPEERAQILQNLREADPQNAPQINEATIFSNAIASYQATHKGASYDDAYAALKAAGASRVNVGAPDLVETELTKGEQAQLTTDKPAATAAASTLTDLYKARNLLRSGDVNTGIMATLHQAWDKVTANPKAATTQEYQSLVSNTVMPTLRATLGAQFTEKEGQMLLGLAGNKVTDQQAAIEQIIDANIDRQKRRVGTFNDLARQVLADRPKHIDRWIVPVPEDPYAGKPSASGSDYTGDAPPPLSAATTGTWTRQPDKTWKDGAGHTAVKKGG